MEKIFNKLNEKGMTLVEVLATLVLLGIVFVGFMSVFPQMTSFNKITETKLETMNLARKELGIILSEPPREDFIKEVNKSVKDRIWTDKYNRAEYSVEVDYYTNPDLKPSIIIAKAGQVSLYKIHIKVIKDDHQISETFGYIEIEIKD